MPGLAGSATSSAPSRTTRGCPSFPRTTRDADLLGFGASDLNSIAQEFCDIASVEVKAGVLVAAVFKKSQI